MRYEINTEAQGDWKVVNLIDSDTGTQISIVPEAGAILNAFSLKSFKGQINIIDGYPTKKSWLEKRPVNYNSAHLSPFVCRIKNSSFTWEGIQYHFQPPALHGILSDKSFAIIDRLTSASYAELNLKFTYTGNEAGYPFPFDCLLSYRLEAKGRLTITTAIHNRSNHNIPLADGWHHYFSLSKPIDELQLKIGARQRLEYDQNLIPTGKWLDDDLWLKGAAIGNSILDHGYLLDRNINQPLCSLSDPESGLSIQIHPGETYPFLQVYTPDHRRSIALEPLSAAPDALNNGIGLITLAPDHTKTFIVSIQAVA